MEIVESTFWPQDPTEALDSFEAEISRKFDELLSDGAFLQAAAGLWRLSLERSRLWQFADLLSAEALPRGPVKRSGLESDYPVGLFEGMRASWAAALAAIAAGQALAPWRLEQAGRLAGMAATVATTPPPDFAPTPLRLAAQTPDWSLRVVAGTENRPGEPILLVASLVNRWYILDFRPGQSLLVELAELGRPVYVLQWAAARRRDDRSLGDIVDGPLAEAIASVRARHADLPVALIGYSMAGSLAA
ncbi:MAG: hypothetical protein KGR26_05885, partial [Cyanobacteria bacterium REEB65]|nr:hypothetical protein [Cyanobacteria bacterium REEB65]